jgi:hypothetical protein
MTAWVWVKGIEREEIVKQIRSINSMPGSFVE